MGDITVAFDGSQITITSGSVGQVEGYSTKPITISGGSIGGPLLLAGDTQAVIYGSDFTLGGVNIGYGEIVSVTKGNNWTNEPFRFQ